MSRNRRSARQAGSSFERLIADHLKVALDNDYIDRRVRTGALDRGDIGGVRAHSRPVVIETKDYAGQVKVAEWLRETETERVNDAALAGVVIAKRRGVTDPNEQIVLMTVNDFVALVTGVNRKEGGASE